MKLVKVSEMLAIEKKADSSGHTYEKMMMRAGSGLAREVSRLATLPEGEQAQVEQMIEWCRQGPPAASVSGVEVSYSPYQGAFTSFELAW